MKVFLLTIFICVASLPLVAQTFDYVALEKEFKAETELLEELHREVALDEDMPFIEKTKAFRRITAEYEELLKKYCDLLKSTLNEQEQKEVDQELQNFLNKGVESFEIIGVMEVNASRSWVDSTALGVIVAKERLIDVRDTVKEVYNKLLHIKNQ